MAEPYQKLAQYLDKLPAGYPPTDNGVELRILRHLFSEQEADLALHLTLIYESARVVAFRAHQPVEQVTSLLDGMAQKGLISVNRVADKPAVYSINQFVVGFWEGQVNRLDSELVELFGEYAPIFFQKGPWKEFPQMRTIPIHEAIPITSEVIPYENAEAILRSKTLIAVRNCVCRQEHQLSGDGCHSILEACLSFDGAAKNTVETGKGRYIGLDEALSILDQAKNDGLILQPANSKNPIYLCACCKCCCGVLTHIKKHPEPGKLVSNPYYATYDPELCISCGACLDVCPMEALTMDNNDNVVFNQLRCIGCGLCVTVCPSQAIKIVRKPDSIQPTMPKNTLDTYLKMAFKRKSWKVIDLVSLVIRSFVDRLIAPR